jgi:hypothetical protein
MCRKVSGLDAEHVGARVAQHVLELSVPSHRVGVRLLVHELLVAQIVHLGVNVMNLFIFSPENNEKMALVWLKERLCIQK